MLLNFRTIFRLIVKVSEVEGHKVSAVAEGMWRQSE